MPNDTVRLSQVVGVFGPGAMLDLPDRSVLVQGLDHWEMGGKGTFRTIEEPRLARLLHQRLGDDGRVVGDRPPELRTPPLDPGDPKRLSPGIKATVFPRWFACDALDGDVPNRRRLVPFHILTPPKRLEHLGEDGKRRRASPIRFVCGCEEGHLQDIEWRKVVHTARSGTEGASDKARCAEQMWLVDGVSGDPRDTRVACDCGASVTLEELFQRGRLGPCPGRRPWIGDAEGDVEPCTAPDGLRLLTRSATNTYFPQVASVISLPQSEDRLSRLIEEFWSVLQQCGSAMEVSLARKFNPALGASLAGFPDDDVFDRLQTFSAGTTAAVAEAEDPRIAEYEVLASGRGLIGENSFSAKLHAETLPRDVWDPHGADLLDGIASVVAVHRLREVSCLYGFTRFEPAPLASDDLEDVGLAVRGAALGRQPEWLPAVEQFGEGFFIRFAPEALDRWLARPEVEERARRLREGANAWRHAKEARGQTVPPSHERERPDYVMVHSLAHALVTEVAIDCGYPASSLKERVYVLPVAPGQPRRCGLLIYTATAGNQGTLGGLVEVTRRFERVLASALERLELCSGDPVCADHDPPSADEDRMLHGAACHGCLLISETSCEARNLYLDRSLLVDTVGQVGAGYFIAPP